MYVNKFTHLVLYIYMYVMFIHIYMILYTYMYIQYLHVHAVSSTKPVYIHVHTYIHDRASLFQTYKKTLEEGFFPMVVVDANNHKVMYMYAIEAVAVCIIISKPCW